MNVIIWARVSSREQREGYSIDAQLRACRARAERDGSKIVQEFAVAESAKRGAARVVFNEMFDWVRKNARAEDIQAILSHKLDRVCRNMRDAVRLQELEDRCGVKLAFVDNQFGPGAAGMLSFNVMAAVAQYYSDNLRAEVLKGKDEKVLQGWLPCGVPYGYMNVQERNEPIKPHPDRSKTIVRIFDLYARGNETFESLAEKLAGEGHVYRPSLPRFHRTALSYILGNRFYIGELVWHGKSYPGKHVPIVSKEVFQACQDILHGKNRRSGRSDAPLADRAFHCAYCGQSMTGERIRRKLRDGGVREHLYYRCANNHPGAGHPTVRWRSEDLDAAIVAQLGSLRIPQREIHDWFRSSLQAAFANVDELQRQQKTALAKRKTELKNMQDRLLNAYLAGTVEEGVFQDKGVALKTELAQVEKSLDVSLHYDPASAESAVRVFDWTQRAADVWRRSNIPARREILHAVSLNRTVRDASLCLEWRRPFDVLAKRPSVQSNRGERI